MAKRFNVEIANSETGEDTTRNWILEGQVTSLLGQMKEGDALVINRVEDSKPGTL